MKSQPKHPGNFIGNILLLSGCILLYNCTVSINKIPGSYLSSTGTDTLYIQNQSRYEYVEKLNSGVYGWTEGEWYFNKNKVRFKCDKKPLVAYRRKIVRDTTMQHFQVKLLLGDTKEPVNIEQVKLFKNRVVTAGAEKEKNVVWFKRGDIDSVVIYTGLFKPIALGRQHLDAAGYVVRIYPEERLYELDKQAFRVTGKTLKSTGTKEYTNHKMVFNKLK